MIHLGNSGILMTQTRTIQKAKDSPVKHNGGSFDDCVGPRPSHSESSMARRTSEWAIKRRRVRAGEGGGGCLSHITWKDDGKLFI